MKCPSYRSCNTLTSFKLNIVQKMIRFWRVTLENLKIVKVFLALGRNHTIMLFAQFSCINVFLSYHIQMQFSCSASCQTEVFGFFSKEIVEAISRCFAVKAFTQYVRNFSKICRADGNIMGFVN